MRRKKSLTIFSIAVLAFVLAVMIFSLPFGYSVYASATDFEAFDSAFSAMMQKYDNDEVVSASSVSADVGEDKGYCDTRLIVNSHNKINTMGAEMWCGYNDTFILQYTDSSIAAKAYEYYQKENLNVFYDLDVCLNDYEVEEVHSDGIFNINSTSYNSWGWSSVNDYMGTKTYLSSLNAYNGALNDVVVAVLDTGINTSHTIFTDRMITNLARGYTGTGSYEDDNGHGTHVSGTIAEITPSCVKILPLKVLDSAGNGKSSYIINALNHLINQKSVGNLQNLKVINMSLGITTSSVPTGSVTAYATNINSCINELYNDGVLSVVSAGNENANTYNIQPANVANAITISALSVDGAGENRVYTNDKAKNWGTKLLKATYSNYGDAVDFAAPGTWILSSYIGSSTATAYLSGTSMAAPHATACVALYYVHPNHTSDSVESLVSQLNAKANKSCLVSSGAYALTGDKNKYYGYGCLNIGELGIGIDGNVSFSNTEKLHNSSFSTIISYSEADSLAAGENYEIYYTFDETVDKSMTSKDNMLKYSHALTITKSCKLTAVAYVFSGSTVVRRSEVGSITYYLNNKDIESNYATSGGTITSYYGTDPDLTTLVVPQSIGGVTITTIGSGAFPTNCYVKELRLPSTITTIAEKAFYATSKTNTNLEKVYFSGNEIVIGSNAFRGCVNLTDFDVSGITTLDTLALYNTKIESLELFKVTTVGKNAVSQTKLKKIYFGKYLTEFGSQTLNMNGGDVYGYNDVAKTFANTYSANYHDMVFKIESGVPSKKYVDMSSQNSVNFKVVVNGAKVSFVEDVNTTATKDATLSVGEKNVFDIKVSNLTSKRTVKFKFKDMYGTILAAETEIENVAGKTSYTVAQIFGSKFQYSIVYVNGDEIDDAFKFYEGISYTVKIDAQDGCVVKNISISGNSVNINEERSVTIKAADFHAGSYDGISYDASESGDFEVDFRCENGKVKVDGEAIGYKSVNRDDSLTFTIENDIGYKVVRVNVNNSILLANPDGSYTISDIRTNKYVDVIFELAYYSVDISYVASCASYVGVDLSKIAYGTKNLQITLSADKGYVIDFVTVDGKNVSVKNGTFVIDEVKGDVDVVVSFRQTKSIFSSENSTILYYFIVFAVLFVIFVLAKVVLYFVRKKQV